MVLKHNFFDFFGLNEGHIRSLYSNGGQINNTGELVFGSNMLPPTIPPSGGSMAAMATSPVTKNSINWIFVLLIVLFLAFLIFIVWSISEKRRQKEMFEALKRAKSKKN